MAGKKTYQSSVKLPPLADLFSTQEEREEATLEKVMPIPLSELHDFPNHPFQVRDDEEMEKMAESVNTYGVLVPAIVRPRAAGGYEVIAGHRRKFASQKAGKTELPCLVRELDDDTAIILMVDSNCQRENVLPSEKAKAFQMKLEAIKRQGQRKDLTSRQLVGKLESADIVGNDIGESGRQVQRYIRLNSLIPELQELVDEKKLKFNPAVEISYLKPEEQQEFFDYITAEGTTPSLSQAQKLKQASKENRLSVDTLVQIMTTRAPTVKPKEPQVALPRTRLEKYFPPNMPTEQIVERILKLLEAQYRHRQQGMER